MADFDDPFDALREAARNAVLPGASDVRERGRKRQVRARAGYAATAVALVLVGVVGGVALAGGGSDKSIVEPVTPTITVEPTTEPTTAADVALTDALLDDVEVPGSVCDLPGTVQLKDGKAKVPDESRGRADSGGTQKLVSLYLGTFADGAAVVRADVDGSSDAIVRVDCDNNGGGTGWLEGGVVVLSGKGGTVHSIGVLRPLTDIHSTSPATVAGVEVDAGGVITLKELFGVPSDPHCCPSGRATSRWRWNGTDIVSEQPKATAQLVFSVDELTRTSLRYSARVTGTVPQAVSSSGTPLVGPAQELRVRVLVDYQEVGGSSGRELTCDADADLVPVDEDFSDSAPVGVGPGQHSVQIEVSYCAQGSTQVAVYSGATFVTVP